MDYASLKLKADGIIGRLSQGAFEIGAVSSANGATELDAPIVSITWQKYDAAIRGVSSQYVDGQTILTTDLMAVIEADAAPEVGGLVRLDGSIRNIIRVDNIPAIGVAVAKRVFIR